MAEQEERALERLTSLVHTEPDARLLVPPRIQQALEALHRAEVPVDPQLILESCREAEVEAALLLPPAPALPAKF